MSTPESTERLPVFSSELIRLLVGAITFALPVVVWIASSFSPLSSISASYHTGARDIFVGLLFVLGAFLFAYKGHSGKEYWMANLGSLAAVVAAVCPTTCDGCQTNTRSILHLGAGAALFLVTAYFCLWPFRQAARTKPSKEAGRRARFYIVCGSAIIVCLVVLGIAQATGLGKAWAFTFWAEFFMLWTFSSAWVVAAKWVPWFTNKDEQLSLSNELELGALTRLKLWKK